MSAYATVELVVPAQPVDLADRQALVGQAARVSRALLADDSARLAHSAAVAERAEALAVTVDSGQAPVLVAAAWLHDVGYAAPLRRSGFHPVDGARALRAWRWPAQICRLVAHHSGSDFVAGHLGVGRELAQFPLAAGPVADALTAADQTIGPCGQPMHYEDRMRDMLARHGPQSANARAHPARAPYLRTVAQRVAQRLGNAGHNPAQFGLAR